ncbi:tRNA glutamyl-Q(34) synthetase GluQRS [Marinomonas algicola]|uniref:tRNA glutamyl-Q(34) synthetase GluQRS n=1 Tax=Marinomonas algicola TaxID=2773454 RepID=UPI001749C851|nr:tRNA glutamyl-Q(34) synthetase GluQRS [Marinomonas algicola]
MHNSYVGRFAPSPTGPLHFGSLVCALASYLDAKKNHGEWLIRIEDVDGTRCKPLYTETIISCLSSYGMESDRPIIVQSQQTKVYQHYLEQLKEAGYVFPCNCTRQTLQAASNQHIGPCSSTTNTPHSWRLQSQEVSFHYNDKIQGPLNFHINSQSNCPVLKRKDHFFSYQLAVVVDDHLQGITHIIRGSDLLETTDTQLFLYQRLNWTPPSIGHIPLLLDPRKQKISKQNHAQALPEGDLYTLNAALSYLCIPPSHCDTIKDTIKHAILHWQPAHLRFKSALQIKSEHAHLADQDQ